MPHFRRLLPCALSGMLLAASGLTAPVLAQGVTPQQGNIQGKIAERARETLETRDRAARSRQEGPEVVTEPRERRELPPPGGPTVLLKSVAFEPGSAFLTEAELDAIAARYRGERVDFSQISRLVRDVNDLYAEKGVVTAAAILPPQQLSDGNLRVRLVEGQLGNVALVGEHRTKSEFVFDRVTLARGSTVDVPTASEDIQRFNALNRAQLRMLLQPGAEFGYTDLLLGITEPPEQELKFYLDNEGVESTGEAQLSALYRRYGLLGIDDTLMGYVAVSEGSKAVTLRYEFPVGTFGTRLAVTGTASDVSVVAGPTKVLNIDGDSKSLNLSASHPLFIDDKWTVLGTASAFYGTSASDASTVPLVDSETRKLATGVTLSYSGDNGSVTARLQGIFAKSKDKVADASRDIFLLAGSVAGQYRFDGGLTLVGTGAWQHTGSDLLPGDLLFQIGGPTTVRGYPSDGIAGDSGFYGNLELHKQFAIPNSRPLDGYVFTDFGAVYSTFPKRTSLISAGAGVNYSFNDRVEFSLSVAAPLKDSLSNQSDYTVYAGLTVSVF